MSKFILWFDSLSPFWQQIVGSAVIAAFALLLKLLQKITSPLVMRFSKSLYRAYSHDLIFKHWVHKKFVKSSSLAYFTYGHFFIVLRALRWVIVSALILVFYSCVSALVERNWLRLIASYFALNYLFEAFSWLKDRSNEDTIKNIDPEVKK